MRIKRRFLLCKNFSPIPNNSMFACFENFSKSLILDILIIESSWLKASETWVIHFHCRVEFSNKLHEGEGTANWFFLFAKYRTCHRIFEKFFKKGFILHCKLLIINGGVWRRLLECLWRGGGWRCGAANEVCKMKSEKWLFVLSFCWKFFSGKCLQGEAEIRFCW